MKRWIHSLAAALVALCAMPAHSAMVLSQTESEEPSTQLGIACSDGNGIYPFSVWRRFYFEEYGVRGSATVESVTVTSFDAVAPMTPTPIAVRLYSIPHDIPADTLPATALTPLASATGLGDGTPAQRITLPVVATIADGRALDLVVEYRVDAPATRYYAFNVGANDSPEMHPSFFSGAQCGAPDIVLAADAGFRGTHPIMLVNLSQTGPGLPRLTGTFAPAIVAAGQSSRLTMTLDNVTRPAPATLTADLVNELPNGLLVAPTPNASTNCAGGSVAAAPGSGRITLSGAATVPASGSCTMSVDVWSTTPGRYVDALNPGSLATDVGSNLNAGSSTLLVTSSAPPAFPPGETFDANPAPLLPNGWTSSSTTGDSDWITVTSSDAGPNAVWTRDRLEQTDFTLDSPVFVPVQDQNLSFRQRYDIDLVPGSPGYGIDGGALEISIDGGAFVDVVTAGGQFAVGGYNATLLGVHELSRRQGWSGDTAGQFVTATVTLPAAAVGHPTRLRFHFASAQKDPAYYRPRASGGWWVDSIVLGIARPPSASLSQPSLSFTVAANDSATTTLGIFAAVGSDPLLYSLQAHDAGAAAGHIALRTPVAPVLSSGSSPDAASYRLDDGSIERVWGYGIESDDIPAERAAVWINRFHAAAALTVDSVSVYWPDPQQAGGNLLGLQPNLVAYYDADADGDPSNAVRVGMDTLVTIGRTGDYETYRTNFAVPGEGDVYIGFVDYWAIGGRYRPQLFPAAADTTTPQGRSYISASELGGPPVDIVTLSRNVWTGPVERVTSGVLAGNWMIRATSTGNPSEDPCTGLLTNWLSAVPSSGVVEAGSSASVRIRATPAIGRLAPGEYDHQLCIATNDPTQPVIVVPVHLSVTSAPCLAGDSIFCSGFEAGFVQPVADPSFESVPLAGAPSSSWTSEDGETGYSIFYDWHSHEGAAHSGNMAGFFGGAGHLGAPADPRSAFAEQTVTLPDGGALFLNYWRFNASPSDVPTAFVVLVDGQPVDSLDVSAVFDGGFIKRSIDISAWADGGAHTVRFQWDYRGNFHDGLLCLDDVTIERQPLP